MSKHEKVRQRKDELEKLARIENDLKYSKKLLITAERGDAVEFEAFTDKEFNKRFIEEIQS